MSVCSQSVLHVTSTCSRCQPVYDITGPVQSSSQVRVSGHTKHFKSQFASVILLCRRLRATHPLPITAYHYSGSIQASVFISTTSVQTPGDPDLMPITSGVLLCQDGPLKCMSQIPLSQLHASINHVIFRNLSFMIFAKPLNYTVVGFFSFLRFVT